MHTAQLAEIASILAHAGPAIMVRAQPIPPEAVNQYWVSSRTRLDLWHQTLARYTHARASGNSRRMRWWWEQHLGVLEEIFVSEITTRIVAVIADGVDRSTGRDDFSPITQAIHLSHLEARNRVQAALLDRRGCSVSDAVRLNQLRRMVERWIDTLVGGLAVDNDELSRFGVDPERTRSHAAQRRWSQTVAAYETLGWLTRTAMVEGLRRKCSARPSLPQANRAVADSLLMMLRPEMFDSVGHLKSLWLHRMEQDADRTDQIIDQYMKPDIDDTKLASAYDAMHSAVLAHWFR